MFQKSFFTLSFLSLMSSASVISRQFTGSHSGDGTWYNTGLGSCGISNVDTDYVVAVSGTIFNNYPGFEPGSNPNLNPICGKTVTANYGSHSVRVAIVDLCGGCKEFDLDLSPAAFGALADPGLGRIPITWSWD